MKSRNWSRPRGRARPRTLALLVVVAAVAAGCSFTPSSAKTHIPPPPPAGAPGDANSADRLVLWVACPQVIALTDEALDMWKARGVDGFVCTVQSLAGIGGPDRFSADVARTPAGPDYDLQRSLRDARIVERAAAKGLDVYLGFYLLNRTNFSTPLVDWFDDGGWSTKVIPAFQGIAGSAHALGMRGLAFDQELYPQQGNVSTATWAVGYPGNTRTEAEVRDKVRERGRELMTAMVGAFPGLELLAYGTRFPDSWGDTVQLEVNDIKDASRGTTQIDFWDGLSSVEGYATIRLLDADFYKSPNISGASWDAALQQEYNQLYALLSQRFSNWAYAAPRFEESPFSWISDGSSQYERARSPAEVTEQLDAFNRWGMGRMFANFVFDGLDAFDYTDYVPAMQQASTPRVVTDKPPTIAVTKPSAESSLTATGDQIVLEGEATDPYAIRYVQWRNELGEGGMAQLVWDRGEGSVRGGYANWKMQWTANVSLHQGANTIQVTAVSIKGLSTTATVTVNR